MRTIEGKAIRRELAGYFAMVGLAGLLLPMAVWADHCPDDLVIPGNPEHQVAGLDIAHDALRDAKRLFGASARHREGTDVGYPKGSGWVEYEWTVATAKLTIVTEFYTNDAGARVETVTGITVEGSKPVRSLRTGRGAGLGDTLGDIERVYGVKHMAGSLRGSGPDASTVTFCYQDETALEFVFDSTGKASQVFLSRSEE